MMLIRMGLAWPRASLPEIPFLCYFEGAVEVAASDPYLEIFRYLKMHLGEVDKFETLSCFDAMNFAPA